MARPLFGGSDTDFLVTTGVNWFLVYDAPSGTRVTDLRKAVATPTGYVVGEAQDRVYGDDARYYAYYAPNGWIGPMWSPKAYQQTGVDGAGQAVFGADWSKGAVRIDPDPTATYALKGEVSPTLGADGNYHLTGS